MCCEDKEHCCPQGSVCNMVQQTCDHSTDSLTQTWIPMEKRPAVAVQNERTALTTVKCEDQTECRDGNTCCQQLDGSYACCQYSKVSIGRPEPGLDIKTILWGIGITVETLYNTINFCWSTHKRHSIARPKGPGMGCLLWVQRATYCVDLSLLSSMKYLL